MGLGHWSVPGGASKLRGLATDRQLQALETTPIPNLGSGGNSYVMVFDKSSEISPLKVVFPPPRKYNFEGPRNALKSLECARVNNGEVP